MPTAAATLLGMSSPHLVLTVAFGGRGTGLQHEDPDAPDEEATEQRAQSDGGKEQHEGYRHEVLRPPATNGSATPRTPSTAANSTGPANTIAKVSTPPPIRAPPGGHSAASGLAGV